jgi:hypothetical protein
LPVIEFLVLVVVESVLELDRLLLRLRLLSLQAERLRLLSLRLLALACTCRVGFASPPAGDNVNTTNVAPMVARIAWLIVTILLAVALCRGLSLPVGCGAFSLDCLLSRCS